MIRYDRDALLAARRQRNRESATRSRERTKATVQSVNNELTELREDFEQLRRNYDSLRESFGKLIRACQTGDFTDVQFRHARCTNDGNREDPRDANREYDERSTAEAVDAASGDEGTQTVAERE